MLKIALSPGQEVLLDIRNSARRRIVCGLRWNPIQDTGTTANRTAVVKGANTTAHDLDLLCLLFDKYGRFIDGITGEEGHRTGDEGNIYHTGDVVDGDDSLDDEQISLELFNLSRKIHQVFFIAEVQSAHTFGEIFGCEIRIANAIDDRNMAHSHLGRIEGGDHNSFIFGSIYRCPQGWMFKYVGEYMDGTHVSDWTEKLKDYVIAEAMTDEGGRRKGPARPAKGQTVPLNYSLSARQRVICGLSWDPTETVVGKAEKLKNAGHNVETFDLDLACVLYNADGEAVDGVSAKADETIDSSGKVYHTGDDTSGEGGRDDEAVSVELKDLPDYIHHAVFLAEIQSLHTFADITNPSMRIADGKTEEEQLVTALTAPAGAGKNAYIFARISRHGEGWVLRNIDEYVDGTAVEDWIAYLQRYLS